MIKVKVSRDQIIEAGLIADDSPFVSLPDFITLEGEPIEDPKQIEPLPLYAPNEMKDKINELIVVVNRLTKK